MNELKEKLKQNLYLIIFILFSAAAAVFLIVNIFFYEDNYSLQPLLHHTAGPTAARNLDGREVAAEDANLRPVIVMMENHYESRPISGLEYASVVYESIVEADITRFLAVFDPKSRAQKIGPVRSARPFFVQIAKEWDGVYFHAGGSPQGLELIKNLDIDNVNEISADGIYFWRDSARFAPHNLYTSINQINRAIEGKEYATSTDFLSWKFKTEEKSIGERASEIEFNFSDSDLYRVKYIYNEEDNNYTRYQNGSVHKTATGIILKANNIVRQFVNSEIIDYYGRLDVDVSSGGKATIYQDGVAISGSWKKQAGRTRYFDDRGEEIRFNIGTTWIELEFNN